MSGAAAQPEQGFLENPCAEGARLASHTEPAKIQRLWSARLLLCPNYVRPCTVALLACLADAAAEPAEAQPASKRRRGARRKGPEKCDKCRKNGKPGCPKCPGWAELQHMAAGAVSTASACIAPAAAASSAVASSGGAPTDLDGQALIVRPRELKCLDPRRAHASSSSCPGSNRHRGRASSLFGSSLPCAAGSGRGIIGWPANGSRRPTFDCTPTGVEIPGPYARARELQLLSGLKSPLWPRELTHTHSIPGCSVR